MTLIINNSEDITIPFTTDKDVVFNCDIPSGSIFSGSGNATFNGKIGSKSLIATSGQVITHKEVGDKVTFILSIKNGIFHEKIGNEVKIDANQGSIEIKKGLGNNGTIIARKDIHIEGNIGNKSDISTIRSECDITIIGHIGSGCHLVGSDVSIEGNIGDSARIQGNNSLSILGNTGKNSKLGARYTLNLHGHVDDDTEIDNNHMLDKNSRSKIVGTVGLRVTVCGKPYPFPSKKLKNAYAALNLSPTELSRKNIRNSYLKLIKLHHPDNGSRPNKALFMQALEAYESLTKPIAEKRPKVILLQDDLFESKKSEEKKSELPNKSEMPDYYQILGVERGASTQAIQKAFRKVALARHPDKNMHLTTAELTKLNEDFKLVNKAHEVLIDPVQRSNYDLKYKNTLFSSSSSSQTSSGEKKENQPYQSSWASYSS